MDIKFKNLKFGINNSKIILEEFGNFRNISEKGFSEIHISGENKPTHEGIKLVNSSEGRKLSYVSHYIDGEKLCIIQESDLIRLTTFFSSYDDTKAIRAYSKVENISNDKITVEDVSSIVVGGLSSGGISNFNNMFFTKFIQSHHAECQPERHPFTDYGFVSDPDQRPSQKRIAFANIGSWSTKEELPQGIIEDAKSGSFLMFQIESSSSWYYEISDRGNDIYLYLGGANSTHGNWHKELLPGQSYCTHKVAITVGDSLNELLSDITKYRRHISGFSQADKNLPTIFNDYMHLSWDSPTEENTFLCAPFVAKTGIDYYVIDCGWHDEVPGNVIYRYVGKWKESKMRFPKGIRYTSDYIHSLGMKVGLWIEPEVVGIDCKEMLEYYGDDCFYQRYGKKVAVHDRYFLDYRHPKVISYMTETIRRMVEDYGADYIKFDYNQDCGIGTDYKCSSPGEGLEECTKAFFDWVEKMKTCFPNVIFEGCASGGMRMDYNALSNYSLMSTSDQTNYLKYPCIVANILSAVIPEQAAVWSYPVAWLKKENISTNCTAMNMINSFLGRLHLASHIDWLDADNFNLVCEGVGYFNKLSLIKTKAVPYLPMGFAKFGQQFVSAGLKYNSKIYLAVWNLSDKTIEEINIKENIVQANIVYPKNCGSNLIVNKNSLLVNFQSGKSAVFIEIEIDE